MPRFAAVDIGSNSVRMLAADVNHSTTQILAEDRQVTRLGESVFRTGRISEEAMQFLVNTLTRLAGTYQALDVVGVRVVATSAVRDAENQAEFVERASAALGAPVEIISGAEEARLIHLGIESRWPRPDERTLIIDVGGGSAELIFSQHGKLLHSVSKPLGAVRLTAMFLDHDPPRPEELHRMNQYIDEKLLNFRRAYGEEEFDRAIATSATAAALVCAVNRVPRGKRDQADRLRATRRQIHDLYATLSTVGLVDRRKLVGIGPRRAEIVTAGAAVFSRTLEIMQQSSIYYSAAGVRDGIIADLAQRGVSRELTQLSREQRKVVESMAARYRVSLPHVRQVALFAHRLFELTFDLHRLPPSAGKLLEAAAILHDVGHFVSDTAHHKHSAYLVLHADLPSFNSKERMLVASLCRFHRKSLPQARHAHFQMLDPESKRAVVYLAPLLRVADALDRSHEQKVLNISGLHRNGQLVLAVEAEQNIDLELWAAAKAGRIFGDVYGKALTFEHSRARSRSAAGAS